MQRRRQAHGLRQKKSLGQVFLKEDWPCRKMAEHLSQHKVRSVLEIGPGGGALTGELLGRGFDVTAVEKDSRFAERLEDQWGDRSNFTVICEDMLQFDLESWVRRTSDPSAVCGNVPYNISSPLLGRLLPSLDNVKTMIFMFQDEFAQRVVGRPSTKAYGSLSVYCQLRAKTKMEFKVSRFCFQPVPRVDSAVVSFMQPTKVREQEELNQIETITRQAFNQRRKKLGNSLSSALRDKDIRGIPVDLTRRCETLSPEEFELLAQFLFH